MHQKCLGLSAWNACLGMNIHFVLASICKQRFRNNKLMIAPTSHINASSICEKPRVLKNQFILRCFHKNMNAYCLQLLTVAFIKLLSSLQSFCYIYIYIVLMDSISVKVGLCQPKMFTQGLPNLSGKKHSFLMK